MRTWNAGKGRKVTKWVSSGRKEWQQFFAVTGVLAVLIMFAMWLFILGTMWGQMGRDCSFMAQNDMKLPEYCNSVVLQTM